MKTVTVAALAAVFLGASACSSGGTSTDAALTGNADGQGVQQVHCYATGTDPARTYPSFSIEVLGESDCTAIANAARYSVGSLMGMTVAPSASRVPGKLVCSGIVGNYPVYIYDSLNDTGLCADLGVPAVP